MNDIRANLDRLNEAIAAACARAGRSPETVQLVAVSKRKPPALVLEAAAAGVVHFGENRVEELQSKREAVDAPVVWHMIGHIQSRKARFIPHIADVVEAVDSLKIAEKLSRLVVEGNRDPLPVLVQVNVSGEDTKGGLEAAGWQADAAVRDAVLEAMGQIAALPGLALRGLMTMAPFVADAEQTRPVFASLRGLRDALVEALGVTLPDLSMGMTNDFPVAIEEGATLIRVGRAIFGERD